MFECKERSAKNPNLRRIWEVELDLLKEFARVCEKNKLQYYLDAGTLLGAARHRGFIPWDDDVDVIMPRNDYDRLWDIASEEFKAPYFFQTTLSEVDEERFCRTHAQLRNSDTTAFIESDRFKNINKGIFLDIFPLDAVPDSRLIRFLFRYEITLKRALMFAYCSENYKKNTGRYLFWLVSKLFFKFFSFKKFFDNFNKQTLGRYKNRNTRQIGDISLKWRENVIWERAWFIRDVTLFFEGYPFKAPIYYKRVLKRHYGDWERIPNGAFSGDMRVHTEVTFDPDTPYDEYFKFKVHKK